MKLKMLKYIFAPLTIAFAACEKVVDFVPLDKEPQLVIEGTITETSNRIKIVRTVPFNALNSFPPVSGAAVRIWDDSGTEFFLEETAPGEYSHPDLEGVPGQTYRLEMEESGSFYQAQSKMPQAIPIENLDAEEVDGEFGETTIAVNVWFTDPPEEENYYVFRLEQNGLPVPMFYTFSDLLHNGQQIKYQLIKEDEEEDGEEERIQSGDRVKVSLLSVDKNVYNYFRHLGWLADSGGPNQPTSNPVSNIQSACLGYFSAHTISEATMVIP